MADLKLPLQLGKIKIKFTNILCIHVYIAGECHSQDTRN